MAGCVVKFQAIGIGGSDPFIQYYLVAIDDPTEAAGAVSAGLQEADEAVTTEAPVAQQVISHHGMMPGDVGIFPAPRMRKRHY